MNIDIKDLIIPGILVAIVLIFIGFLSLSLLGSVNDKESIITDLNSTLSNVNNDLNSKINDISQLTTDKTNLINQVSSLNNNISILNNDKTLLQAQNADFVNTIHTQDANIINLKQDLNLLNIDFNITKRDLNISKTKVSDMNTIARNMYSNFENCYWASNCASNETACKTKFGTLIDVNIVQTIKANDCRNISISDLNIFSQNFK